MGKFLIFELLKFFLLANIFASIFAKVPPVEGFREAF
jgi:hypothetical protein